MRQHWSAWTPDQRSAVGAASWCVAFGLLSLYWAAGGTLGVGQLAPSLQERAGDRDGGFVLVVLAAGIAKLLGALVPLALVFGSRSASLRKFLLILCWAGGVFVTLYGVADIVGGTVREITGSMDGAVWYAVLWGPIWLIGGLLFLATAWTYRRGHPVRTVLPGLR